MDFNKNLKLGDKITKSCHHECILTDGVRRKCSILFDTTSCNCKESWLKDYGLVTSEDMHPDFRELHLKYGYRPLPSSFMYCLKSVFYPTNETLNFWTHFIAVMLFFDRFHTKARNFQGPVTDPIYLPFFVYAFGTCLMLIGSCIAHMFCSVSRTVRESCWFCDYGSITLSSLGSAVVYSNYICPFECAGISFPNSNLILGVFGVFGHAACCYSRTMKSKWRYLLRSSVFIFLYVGSSVPCGIKYFSVAFSNYLPTQNASMPRDIRCDLDTQPHNNAVNFFLVTSFCALTVFFNVSKIPERWFPGKFDIVGHSHQWLHISIAVAFYYLSCIVEDTLVKIEDMKRIGALSSSDLHITNMNTVGVMAFTGVVCLITSWLFTPRSTLQKKTQ